MAENLAGCVLRSRVFQIIAVIVVFAMVAPGFAHGKPVPSGNIKGHAYDSETSAPLYSAQIYITGPKTATVYTDAAGYYEFLKIPAGTYTMSASDSGYYSDSGHVVVLAAQTTVWENFHLTPQHVGNVVGTLIDNDTGLPVLRNARVTLANSEYSVLEYSTNPYGAFDFNYVEQGTYTMTITREDYYTYTLPTLVVVVEDQTTDVGTIYLTQVPGMISSTLHGGTAVRIGGTSYIFGGMDLAEDRQIVKYNLSSGMDQTIQNALPTAMNNAASVWTGQYVYLFGGGANQAIRYNPADDSVVVYSNILPYSPTEPSAIWTGTYVYLFSNARYSIVRFDPSTNTATTMPTQLPWSPNGPCAVFDGRYAYVFGFTYPTESKTGVLRYDTQTDTVATFLDSLPGTCTGGSFATWDGRYAHIFGGYLNLTPSDEVWRFDPASADTVVLSERLDRPSYTLCGVTDGYSTYMFDDESPVMFYCDYSVIDDRGVDSSSIYVGGAVDVASGNLVIVEEDISVQGRGSPITFVRTYNSFAEDIDGQMDRGWRHNYEVSVDETPSGAVMLTQSCGSRHLFVKTYDGIYITPPGLTDRLTKNSSTGTFTLWSLDGSRREFDNSGRLSKIIDKNSNTLTLTYSIYSGCLTNISDGSGAYLRFTESNGHITGVFDSSGDGITYYYSYADDYHISYVSHREPNGYTTPLVYFDYYSDTGLLQSMLYYVEDRWVPDYPYSEAMIMDCNNYSYDSYGRVTQVWKSEAAYPFWPDETIWTVKKYSIEYLSQTTVRSTCALGGTLTVEMNAEKLPVHVYGAPMTGVPGSCGASCGGSALFPGKSGNEELTMTWTDSWQIASSTDGNGNTYNYTYDGAGNLLSVTNPMGNSASYEYDMINDATRYISLLKNSEDELGYDTTYEYDSRGNVLKVTDALGKYVQYTCDSFGNVLTETNKRGFVTTNVYDSRGYLISTTNALGYTTYFNYSATGELEDVTSPLGYSTSAIYNETYEAPETVTYPDGGVVNIDRFITGDISEYMDQSGNVTGYDLNVTLRTNDAVTDALGYTTSYYYNSMGFLTRVQDANGHSYSFTYDSYARLKTITYPLGQVLELWYDHAGNIVTRRDANGNETDYVYDALDRLVQTRYPDGQTMTWTYDAGSRITNVSGNGFWESMVYDALGQPITIRTGYQFLDSGNTVRDYTVTETMTYDANGNALTDAFTAGAYSTSTTYTYDAIDRMTRVTAQSGLYWQFYYDADNRRTNLVANPGGGGLTPYNISYAYDELGNVLSTTTLTSPGTWKPSNGAYQYDAMGRMISSNYGEISWSYSYDAIGQLASCYGGAVSGSSPYWINFTYDGVGNRLSMVSKGVTTTYAYDANDRLTSSSDGYTYSYDDNGNMISASKVGDVQKMYYDYENRLVSVVNDNVETARYDYSAGGDLMVRSFNAHGIYWPDLYIYTHVTDLPSVALRYSEGYGWVYDVFYYSMNTDEVLGMKYGLDNLEYFYFLDAMANTRSVATARTSTPTVMSQSYTPFGVMTSVPTSETHFWARMPSFQGRTYDFASGMYNFRARNYNPSTGKFAQLDPIPLYGRSGYAFTDNSPLTGRDPTGMWTVWNLRIPCWTGKWLSPIGSWHFIWDTFAVTLATKTATNLAATSTCVYALIYVCGSTVLSALYATILGQWYIAWALWLAAFTCIALYCMDFIWYIVQSALVSFKCY